MDFEQIVRWYFAGEKAEALWILAAGIVASMVVARRERRRGAASN